MDEAFERADKFSAVSTRHTVDHFLVHLMTRRMSLLVQCALIRIHCGVLFRLDNHI